MLFFAVLWYMAQPSVQNTLNGIEDHILGIK